MLSRFLKRALDIGLSVLGLLLSLPLWIFIPLAIYFEDKGPVFFIDNRITKNRREYRHFKFRSMVKNAEAKTGPVWSGMKDARVNKIGRILRATAMDELPQLINILKGDISFVGPRPERPFFVDKFIKETPDYEKRFAIKAGLTGLAQIYGKYDTPPQEKLKYDLAYIKNANIILDLKLILLSILITMKGGWTKFEPTKAFFENNADRFDSIYSGRTGFLTNVINCIFKWDIKKRLEMAFEILSAESINTVLDIGCGTGRLSLNLAKIGKKLSGIDYSCSMIQVANRFKDSENMVNMEFLCADFMGYNFNGKFDACAALGFFDYTADPTGYFKKISGITNKIFVATFPRKGSPRSVFRKMRLFLMNMPVYFYSPLFLKKEIEGVGFKTVDIKIVGNLYFVEARK